MVQRLRDPVRIYPVVDTPDNLDVFCRRNHKTSVSVCVENRIQAENSPILPVITSAPIISSVRSIIVARTTFTAEFIASFAIVLIIWIGHYLRKDITHSMKHTINAYTFGFMLKRDMYESANFLLPKTQPLKFSVHENIRINVKQKIMLRNLLKICRLMASVLLKSMFLINFAIFVLCKRFLCVRGK